MTAFLNKLVKYKIHILCAAAVIFLVAVLGVVGCFTSENKIDNDVYNMFPSDSKTAEGVAFLRDVFGIYGNAIYVVSGMENDADLSIRVQQSLDYTGVSACLWYGNFENASIMTPLISLYASDSDVDMEPLIEYLKRPTGDGTYDYVLLYFFDEDANQSKLMTALDKNFDGRVYSASGMTPLAHSFSQELYQDFYYVLIVLFVLCVILTLLFARNVYEFLTVFIWIGFSLVLNVGLQFISGKTYGLSLACSCAFLAASSLFFALMFIADFHRSKKSDVVGALKEFIYRRGRTICFSLIIIVAALLILSLVDFEFCTAVGLLTLRGIVVSLLSAILLLPALCGVFGNKMRTGKHNKGTKIVSSIVEWQCARYHVVALIGVVIFVTFCIFGATLKSDSLDVLPKEKGEDSVLKIAEEENNQLLLMLPIEVKNGLTHTEFIEELYSLGYVDRVMSGYLALELPTDKMYDVLQVLEESDAPLFRSVSSLYGYKTVNGETKRYVIYTLTFKDGFEDQNSQERFASLNELIDEYFAEKHSVGVWTGAIDVKELIKEDSRILLLSLLVIIVLCAIAYFRSVQTGLVVAVAFALPVSAQAAVFSIFGLRLNVIVLIMSFVLQVCVLLPQYLFIADEFRCGTKCGKGGIFMAKKSLNSSFGSAIIVDALCAFTALAVLLFTTNVVMDEIALCFIIGATLTLITVAFLLPSLLLVSTDVDDLKYAIPQNLVHMFPSYTTKKLKRSAKRRAKLISKMPKPNTFLK